MVLISNFYQLIEKKKKHIYQPHQHKKFWKEQDEIKNFNPIHQERLPYTNSNIN